MGIVAWQKYLGLDEGSRNLQVARPEQKKRKIEFIPVGSTVDLSRVGGRLYPHFCFREGQMLVMLVVLICSTEFLCVQALPGYGKTLLFHVPLIVLKKKTTQPFVSFVFVPYIPLKENMKMRLKQNDALNVGDVSSLLHGDFGEKDPT
ncbi:uncharacterized protein KNAG_0G02510 [Huiozyma naganishii CBS 8797]|uniref:DEAD/DEAH box helicase domain-containing protein n=1 Tax=Huiozyma naganishii (strain ATCC MYA-139 / BCRC 22969 / CBS 8797 / KCTC 17520 / NBRC 10181 / NCYC 3082 / Yp74L-3) TaxID=1071383 RepID=J7RNV8_HUIN7|nr:hypothetical protein KNAG_0G02510 [Kazachstania naganishii CBS 8797]CCK71308.1 hypothetical protein KNAG_0G02510 [Kazachstania naganishii CBS 8797]